MTFDDITFKMRKISMDTVAEVQKMNEVRQLNSSINAEKKKIHSMYTEMGKKLYDRYRENPPEGFEAEFHAIKAEFENIEVLRTQVRAKKGVTLCPNCKMEVGEFERFCSNCGCKMPEIFKIEEDEPADAESPLKEEAESTDTAEAAEKMESMETAEAVEKMESMETAEAVENTESTGSADAAEGNGPEMDMAETAAAPEEPAEAEDVIVSGEEPEKEADEFV